MNPQILVFDLLLAFVDQDDCEPARQKHRVGEFIVYNKGDKLDWNHPDRACHRRIASFSIEAMAARCLALYREVLVRWPNSIFW